MLHSRTGTRLDARFPEILDAVRALGPVVLDGELVAYREGELDRAALAASAGHRRARGVGVYYLVFDLLADRTDDLRARSYTERRNRLVALLGDGIGVVQIVPATSDRDAAAGWISTDLLQVGIEGVVAKPLTSRYPIHIPSRSGWLKIKQTR
ncbi:ATP dependent DNA ligase domain-containing protein [Prauserella marina]|uniref:ATP dependent DNA ligase domain-containing protein n=1 Tax=Prauserella marina TaxID=530584 RepID=A0A1G6Z5T1_9PSEU|nr:ATP dependent DNA ligase-like protein [Prauserella marina]SDD98029.1 ATP dependent DNA ligase domain-containing protein [Prauserella marina]